MRISDWSSDVCSSDLALVDLLRAVIEAGRVAQAHGVGGREQAEPGIGPDHPVLVEQRHLAVGFQRALDHEHHVGAAGVIFVEHQGNGRSEGHTSELQSLMSISYAVFCLQKKK